jgi:pimeloyl-ACP methyl ester carboxylesterase
MKKSLKSTMYCTKVITLLIALFLTTSSFAQFALHDPNLRSVYDKVTPTLNCKELTKVTIPNTVIVSAVIDPRGFCQVTAVVNHPPAKDRVKVWINLPLKSWNGRFCGTGGGGYLGGTTLLMGSYTTQGFAVGCTDAGHDGMTGAFALDAANHCLNWQEIRDYGYLGIHDMTVVGKAIVQAFYDKPARYSYFVGGSNGGRQGITEAQRYPEDYDGILSYYPAINLTKIFMGGLWAHAVMNDANNILSEEKQRAVKAAAVKACDGDDGVVDGVISDPGHCTWDPKAFVGAAVGNEVFTDSDADVIRKIWEGPRTHDGKFLWYGLPRGADIPDVAGKMINNTFYHWPKYFLTLDPDWNISKLSVKQYELFWNQSMEEFNQVFYGEDPNLTQFKNHGGKLLIVHGLADQLVPYQGSVNYLKQVQNQMGGAKAVSKFLRLFLVPGMDHNIAGEGGKPVGPLDAVVRWVEEGKAPEQLKTEKVDNAGIIIQTRPLFSYR